MAKNRARLGAKNLLEYIANWSYQNNLSEEPYVVSLYTAIKRKWNLPMWATIDPFILLPYPENTAGDKLIRFAKFISQIRNLLVFVPVALTWAAVSQATSAFALFVEKNSATTVNFLEFWQNGYEILNKDWTIGNVAKLDYLIILFVIILSLSASLINERGNFLKLRNNDVIEKERISLAIEIKTFLFQFRQASNLTISEDLQEGLSTMLIAADDLRIAIEEIQQKNVSY